MQRGEAPDPGRDTEDPFVADSADSMTCPANEKQLLDACSHYWLVYLNRFVLLMQKKNPPKKMERKCGKPTKSNLGHFQANLWADSKLTISNNEAASNAMSSICFAR